MAAELRAHGRVAMQPRARAAETYEARHMYSAICDAVRPGKRARTEYLCPCAAGAPVSV